MSQYSYDKWLRPRPNTQWQNLENQIFVDQTPLCGLFEDDEGTSEEDEEDDTSEAMSDIEQSDSEVDNGEEATQAGDEIERRYKLPSRNKRQLPDDEVLEVEVNLACHPTPSGSTEAPNQRTENEEGGSSTGNYDIVSRFLTVMQELAVKDRDLHRDSIARLGQFFKKATLGHLDEASREPKGSRILLEDRNFFGKTFRPCPRSMTPKQLYEALAKLRYPGTSLPKPAVVEAGIQSWGQTLKSGLSLLFSKINGRSLSQRVNAFDVVGDESSVWTASEDCPVERRTLYVSNPNEWAALALVATASPTQAPVLFDFIDRYLKYETSISVNVNSWGARMTLFLHLPFYTFRDQLYTDSRHDHEGSSLRSSREVPYMHLGGGPQDSVKPSRWICESQVSLLVSIIDLHGWTAYLFEDTYYKACEPTQYWDSFCSKSGYYYPDALTSGTLDSTRFLDPRMYFLRVFETRIDQVYREWRLVVDKLEKIVKRHRPDRILYPSAGPGDRQKTKRNKQILLQQRYSEWISKMTHLVSDQSEQISTTLTAWDEFEKRCAKYFPEDIHSPLETSIGHTFSMIKMLKDRLDGLSQEIARDQSALGAQLAVENTGTAKFVKALTVISIVMMPMVLDIALFSIQPGVMPFRMDFLAFVKSYFALALFFCVVWVILSQWDTFVMFACVTYYQRVERAVQVPSQDLSDPTHGKDANEMSDRNTYVGKEDGRKNRLASASRKSVWSSFSAGLLLRRGQQERPVSAVEPAGLAAVVCV